MSILQSLSGILVVEIMSADIPGILDQICKNGISLWDISHQDDLTFRLRICRPAWQKVKAIVQHRGDHCSIVAREGFYWNVPALLKRPVLVLGLVFFLVAVLYLPGRIFFIRVEGNSMVSTQKILEKASDLGICFGASRRHVRSERVKNGLLSSVEVLEWAGVNTKGCTAIISVREQPPKTADLPMEGTGNVVALRDGVVLSCDVIRGSGACIPGQAVKEGQILISGTIDHGISVTTTAAKGEVFGVTQRQISVLTHAKIQNRGIEQRRTEKFRLLIGKKLINFFKGSGISGGTCVKMYSKYVLTLPGGFQLPIALIRETLMDCDFTQELLDEDAAYQLLSDFAATYTRDQMIAGRILSADENLTVDDQVYLLTGNYACTEMIGRAQQEQIGAYHGKTD